MKNTFFLGLVITFLFFVYPVQAVDIDVYPSHVETYVNERGWYSIEIYNDKAYENEFIVTVLGPHLEWLFLDGYVVKLDAYGTEVVEMYFYPKSQNFYEYEVLVYSNFDEKDSDSETISLKVLPERFVRLLDFSSKKIGDDLQVNMEFLSKGKREIDIFFDIRDSDGRTVKYFEVTREVENQEIITEMIPIGDFLAGEYSIKMTVPEHGLTAEASFYIQPVHKIVKKKSIVSTPFGQEVVVTITNEGNVVEDYNIRESVLATEYVDLIDDPTSSYLEEDNVNYNWNIEGLMVGEVVEKSYYINKLPLLIGSLVVIFGILGLLGMGTMKVRTPNIKKRYVRKRNEHAIVLEIRGSLTKELRNVMVKDRVSPLGKVVPEFEGPKPIVREGESGTELIWRLGDVRPRSEIYLTYKIRPLVEAQLKMPRAYLSYRTEDDRKINVFSKQILLE